jgi:MFS transporter, DHA3 family, macrolide efflux protein
MANGPIGAALQASVPPELQGRVFTLVSAVSGVMMPLGLALAGPLSDIVGARTWFLLAGAACLVLGGAGLFVPAIVRLEEEGAKIAARRAAAVPATSGPRAPDA